MKKVSLLAATLLATTTLASAQVPAPVGAPCPCPKAFQGFFLGGNVGYGIGYANTSLVGKATPATPNIKNTLGLRGFDGGLNLGYTHRFGNFGLGLEGVFNWASTKGTYTEQIPGTIVGNVGQNTYTTKLKNTFQLRANFSYVICNLVAPKIILGWDTSQWQRNFAYPLEGGTGLLSQVTTNAKSKRYNSFLWGVGVDFLLAKHVIAGFEYTGTAAGKKTVSDTANRVAYSFKPQYNKFALTVKVIY